MISCTAPKKNLHRLTTRTVEPNSGADRNDWVNVSTSWTTWTDWFSDSRAISSLHPDFQGMMCRTWKQSCLLRSTGILS
jgi:hypothetical protein